jgi:hypothetical protein
MYQMIQAEKQAASPLEQAGTEQDGLAVEQSGAPNGEAAGKAPVVRETVIVVPGPTVWRIRGTLTVAKGMLALEDDEGILWYLPGLDCYIGFIDGLDAGEEAALEGYAPPRGSSQERYFQPIRLFIDEMAYDLSIPPYGIAMPAQGPGGQTIIIRENNDREDWDQDDLDDWDDDLRDRGERPRSNSPKPQPAWQHNHKSPWAPPTSVLDFEMDYDSFWRDDPAKQERRERDSREIWY